MIVPTKGSPLAIFCVLQRIELYVAWPWPAALFVATTISIITTNATLKDLMISIAALKYLFFKTQMLLQYAYDARASPFLYYNRWSLIDWVTSFSTGNFLWGFILQMHRGMYLVTTFKLRHKVASFESKFEWGISILQLYWMGIWFVFSIKLV